MRVAVVFGTRPEAIKLAPIILQLRSTPGIETSVVSTGQHREMCQQALSSFAIAPDADFDTMVAGQSLGQLTARLFSRIDSYLMRERPDWVLVQGDTTSAMVAATTAFYQTIKVGHVEAGLRTFRRMSPFPEEINRTFVSNVATLHFAPTERARANLLRAGVDDRAIAVTGNTVVDAVRLVKPQLASRSLSSFLSSSIVASLSGRRLIVVTSHRRESFGAGIEGISRALVEIVRSFDDVAIVYPVHLNPNVRAQVYQLLRDVPRIHLVEPLGYLDLMTLVSCSELILTDSGGLQEEAPSFGKPILILRDVTERPEVVEVGAARLVGTGVEAIVCQTTNILTVRAEYLQMANAGNPFGDGHAAQRIVARMIEHGSCP